MTHNTDHFYLNKEEPNKSCLLVLRSIILSQDELVNETVKYGMPCFCYKKKMAFYLWTDKKTGDPYILFVEGNRMDHPLLEQGNRKQMKILTIDPNIDIPKELLDELLQEALDLYRNGIVKS